MSSLLFKNLVSGILVGLLLAPLAASAEDGAAGPRAQVAELNQTLLEIMQAADELGYEGRFAELEPVLAELFDFAFMTRVAVGGGWRELDPAEQERLVERFATMSIANFAARFDGYDGHRFEITGERPGPREAVVVETRLVRPDDDPVGLDYLLREADGRWRIIDVFLDSKFSELARQRAEFSAVLRNRGYAGLVETIDAKIRELSGETAS